MILEAKEDLLIRGFLNIKKGRIENLQYDELGNIIDWDFRVSKEETKENKICYNGWQFANSYGWNNIGAIIAIGNGAVTGGDIPASTNTKLVNELNSARFICPDSKSRVQENIITVSAIWARGQGYTGGVTEWGLFTNLKGQNLTTINSGYMVSRIAHSFTRGTTEDVEINWIITINN
jgi:hypothetical protein